MSLFDAASAVCASSSRAVVLCASFSVACLLELIFARSCARSFADANLSDVRSSDDAASCFSSDACASDAS